MKHRLDNENEKQKNRNSKIIIFSGVSLDFQLQLRIFFHVCRLSHGTVPTLQLQTCLLYDLTLGGVSLKPCCSHFYPPRCLASCQALTNLFLVVFTRVPVCVSGADLCQVAWGRVWLKKSAACSARTTTPQHTYTDMKRFVFYLQPFSVPVTEMTHMTSDSFLNISV